MNINYHTSKCIHLECPVCTENINSSLNCGHFVHKECIIKSGKNECPICRKDVLCDKSDIKKCFKHKIDLKIKDIKESNPYLINLGLNNKILFDILKNYF